MNNNIRTKIFAILSVISEKIEEEDITVHQYIVIIHLAQFITRSLNIGIKCHDRSLISHFKTAHQPYWMAIIAMSLP